MTGCAGSELVVGGWGGVEGSMVSVSSVSSSVVVILEMLKRPGWSQGSSNSFWLSETSGTSLSQPRSGPKGHSNGTWSNLSSCCIFPSASTARSPEANLAQEAGEYQRSSEVAKLRRPEFRLLSPTSPPTLNFFFESDRWYSLLRPQKFAFRRSTARRGTDQL